MAKHITVRPRRLLGLGALLLGLWAAFLLSLTLTALIPRSAVAGSMADAAAFYEGADMFALFDQNDSASLIHHYADAVLLNILWCQDSSQPLAAALDAAFYQDAGQHQGQNLAAAVAGQAPNTSYARYWHGMLVLLKPLLCVTGLEGVKWTLAAVLLALGGVCFALLLRRRLVAAAVSLTAGLVLVQVWLVPLCIEYWPCFALMLLFSDIVLWRGDRLRSDDALFLAAGALVCFFDFLTCEILTLGVPLALLLLVRREDWRAALRRTVRCCAAWLAAYAATWLCKWLLSAAVLGRSVADIALGQGAYRAAGAVEVGVDIGFQPLAAIAVNLSLLFPFKLLVKAPLVWTAFAGLCLLLFCLWFLYRKAPGQSGPAPVLFLIALLPFARYFFISNHAALHPFFTYRDLLITILAVSCAMALSLERRPKRTAKKRRR